MFEDLKSLKVWIRSKLGREFTSFKQMTVIFYQAGTNAFAKMEEVDSQTIADIAAEGAIYAKQPVDKAADHGKIITFEYYDDAGEEHTGYLTLNATNSTTIVQGKDADDVNITDFAQFKTAEFEQVASDTILMGNSDLSAIYGVISDADHFWQSTRYTANKDKRTWIGSFTLLSSVATRVVNELRLNATPKGHTDEHHMIFAVGNDMKVTYDLVQEIAANTRVSWEIKGNASVNTLKIIYFEVDLA